MAKAFYTQEEAAAALATDDDGLKSLVNDGRLTEYRDGPNLMYKGSQIEQLKGEGAGGLSPADSGGPIGLADSSGDLMGGIGLDDSDPAGRSAGRSAAGDSMGISLDDSTSSEDAEDSMAISMEDSSSKDDSVGFSLGDSNTADDSMTIDLGDTGGPGGRSLGGSVGGSLGGRSAAGASRVPGSSGAPLMSDDTGTFAVEDTGSASMGGTLGGTAAGASQSGITIFEDDDVDPSAQTSLGGSGDQIALEGIGSGSGLLDLTNEPDDTSFGAETFDEIMPESSVAGGTVAGMNDSGVGIDTAAAPAGTRVATVAAYEAIDPAAPIFGGLAAGAAAAVLLGITALTLSVLRGDPGFLSFLMGDDGVVAMGPTLGVLAGLPVLGAIIGFVGGKMAGNA